MAKFYGVIGYAVTEMTEHGIYEERIVEKEYVGDVIRNTRRLREGSKINDDITISNQLSIIADPYTSSAKFLWNSSTNPNAATSCINANPASISRRTKPRSSAAF